MRIEFLCISVFVIVANRAAAIQIPSSVDLTPVAPPTAQWPIWVLDNASVSSPGTPFANTGSARGQALVDVVGPHPSDPLGIGPPDGVLDLIQLNSNSPGLPLGAPTAQQVTTPVGTLHSPSLVLRGTASGKFEDVATHLVPSANFGFDAQYPGGSPWGIAAGDYDADGMLDLFYACGGFNMASPNLLLRALGDGTFENTTAAAHMTEIQCSFNALWFDPDLDGDLDLHVTNGHPEMSGLYSGSGNPSTLDRLYRNNGSGSFQEVGAAAGVALASTSFASTTADLDQNGYPDLIVSCFKQFNKVFYSRGDGTFAFMLPDGSPGGSFALSDMQPDPAFPGAMEFYPNGLVPPIVINRLPMRGIWSMSVASADFNADGWMDLVFGSWSFQIPDAIDGTALNATFGPAERHTLYLNRGDLDGDGRGDGLFREAGEELGIGIASGCMGMVLGDFNADGFPDVYVGAGGPQPLKHSEEDYLFVNEPSAWPDNFQADPDQPLSKAFFEVGALSGSYVNTSMAHGANALRSASGRLDLAVGNGGPGIYNAGQANAYLVHQGNSGGAPIEYLAVELSEVNDPLGGLGARVDVIRDHGGGTGQLVSAQRTGNQTFSSQSAAPVLIGTAGEPALFVGVRWPDGRRSGDALWPNGPASGELHFEVPKTSVSLDVIERLNGAVHIRALVKHHELEPAFGSVFFSLLAPGPTGELDLVGVYPLQWNLLMAQGDTWEIQVNLPWLATGFYALTYSDPSTGIVHGEGAFWHDQVVLGGSPSATTQAAAPATTLGIERNNSTLRKRSSVQGAAGAMLRTHESPALVLASFDTHSSGDRVLAGGHLLSWNGQDFELEMTADGDSILEVRDGIATVYMGIATSCCEVGSDAIGTALSFELDPGARLTADGLQLDANGRMRP